MCDLPRQRRPTKGPRSCSQNYCMNCFWCALHPITMTQLGEYCCKPEMIQSDIWSFPNLWWQPGLRSEKTWFQNSKKLIFSIFSIWWSQVFGRQINRSVFTQRLHGGPAVKHGFMHNICGWHHAHWTDCWRFRNMALLHLLNNFISRFGDLACAFNSMV